MRPTKKYKPFSGRAKARNKNETCKIHLRLPPMVKCRIAKAELTDELDSATSSSDPLSTYSDVRDAPMHEFSKPLLFAVFF